jgi:hypothetical protein
LRRRAAAFLLLLPSVALASGDERVLWWLFGGVATYSVVGLALLVFAVRRRVSPIWLIGFAAGAGLCWYVYLGIESLNLVTNLVFMLAAPLLFLFVLRRK